jgi:hypothetical protein
VRRPWALLLGGAAALAVLKLVLVGRNEIVAVFAAHDQLRFAQMAQALAAGEWLGHYDQLTLIRRPAYPIWLWLSGTTGLPQRVAIELLLIAAALALAIAVFRTGLSWPLSLAVFGSVALAPPSLELNDHLLADAFAAPVQVMALACGVLLLGARRARERVAHSISTALCLAVMAETRPERGLVWVQIAALFLVAACVWHAGGRSVRESRKLAALALIPSVLCVVGASAAMATANLVRYGVFTSNELLGSGFLAAWRALQRIGQERPIPFVSVPAESRRKAYGVSPAFGALQPLIEDRLRPGWTATSCEAVSICDDVADGWFPYMLRDAVAMAGGHADARTAELTYRAVAAEVGAACGDGRLACRSAALSLLDTHVFRGLPRLPGSLGRVALLLGAASWRSVPVPRDLFEPVRAAFDRAALRRAALIPTAEWRVSGWVFSAGAPVDEVLLLTGRGEVLASSAPRLARPDVAGEMRKQGVPDPPVGTGFALSADAGRHAGPVSEGLLIFRSAGHSDVVVQSQVGSCQTERVRCAIDTAHGDETVPAGLARIQEAMAAAFPKLVGALSAAGVMAASVVLLRWRAHRPDPLLLGAFSILAATVACRVVAIALVDAAFFPASPRYVYPVVGPYLSALLVLIGMATSSLGAGRRPHALSQ